MYIIDLTSMSKDVSEGYVHTIQVVDKLSSYIPIQGVNLKEVQNQIGRIAPILKRIGLKGPYDANCSAAAKRYGSGTILDPDTRQYITEDFSKQFKVCGLSKEGLKLSTSQSRLMGVLYQINHMTPILFSQQRKINA